MFTERFRAVLSQTPAEVTAILEMQMQMSKKMQEIVRVAESVKVYREKTEQVATMLEHMRLLFADEGERLAEIQETVEDISRGMKGSVLLGASHKIVLVLILK